MCQGLGNIAVTRVVTVLVLVELVREMDKQVKRCIDICRHRNVLQRPNQRGGVGGNRGDICGGLGDSGKSGTY